MDAFQIQLWQTQQFIKKIFAQMTHYLMPSNLLFIGLLEFYRTYEFCKI